MTGSSWSLSLAVTAEAVEQTIEELDRRGGEIPIVGFLAALSNGVALTLDHNN